MKKTANTDFKIGTMVDYRLNNDVVCLNSST